MSKVKIIQIAIGNDGETPTSEYLDDKGRVWYPGGHWDRPGDLSGRKWVTTWEQLELPDEPTDE